MVLLWQGYAGEYGPQIGTATKHCEKLTKSSPSGLVRADRPTRRKSIVIMFSAERGGVVYGSVLRAGCN